MTDKKTAKPSQKKAATQTGKKHNSEAAVSSAIGIMCGDQVSYQRLPMLEVVFDRLIRFMSTSLRNLTADNVDVSLNEISAVRFGPYINSITMPTMIGVFKEKKWGNLGLVYINSRMIYSIIDVLLGNSSGKSLQIQNRPFTTIEQLLLSRTISIIMEDLTKAFEPVCKLDFEFNRIETNPHFAAIAKNNTTAIISKLDISMDKERGGLIDIILPYVMIDPIKDNLSQSYMGEKFGRDTLWENHLASQLWDTNFPIEAVLPDQTLSLREVLKWKVGSQFSINSSPTAPVALKCGSYDLGLGKVGQKSGNVAISIEELYKRKRESS
ncbi:MAG: flagellar motor switch protein FliM [Alphaproteobacteria bacterium CG_4_10_14_0_8_um_filter_37_21]|nr:MAG: flagellar motor switch protein FliM [Alphaproteobacteria bacterium CG_4_10_14_0_8_um_filter_37_21]